MALEKKASLDAVAVARLRKEQDKLLQRGTKAHQWILNLLAKVEKELELKLGAKERSIAL